MAAIRHTNTKPEIRARSTLHSLGYRFRLHREDLPGKPDVTLAKYRAVIFVHGCIWHCHSCRWGTVVPKTRAKFWCDKRAGNVERDSKHQKALKALGWRVVTIWECDAKTDKDIRRVLKRNGLKLRILTVDAQHDGLSGQVKSTVRFPGRVSSEKYTPSPGDRFRSA